MTVPTQMHGLVVRDYGDWRCAEMAWMATPVAGPGQVLIRVGAAALNFPDLLMIEGKYQVKPPLPFVPGRDGAGTIVAMGAGVQGLRLYDRVAAQPSHGAFAPYLVAADYTCIRLPAAVSDADGAAAGTAIATVVAAMRLRARLQPDETVLITGAAGGVGSMGIQYARLLGARPVALVSSAQKEAAALRLGAQIVLRSDQIDPGRDGLRGALRAKGVEAVDVVVDVVGGPTCEAAMRCLRPGGRCVIVGFASGEIPLIAANYVLLKDLIVVGSSLDRLLQSRDPELAAGIDEAFAALADQRLTAEIDLSLPLERFAEGAARIAERKVIGKVVFRDGADS